MSWAVVLLNLRLHPYRAGSHWSGKVQVVNWKTHDIATFIYFQF